MRFTFGGTTCLTRRAFVTLSALGIPYGFDQTLRADPLALPFLDPNLADCQAAIEDSFFGGPEQEIVGPSIDEGVELLRVVSHHDDERNAFGKASNALTGGSEQVDVRAIFCGKQQHERARRCQRHRHVRGGDAFSLEPVARDGFTQRARAG